MIGDERMSPYPQCRAFATVSEAALQQNYRLLAHHAAGEAPAHKPRLIAVVKANAYGHGTGTVVPALLRAGCDFFAVATLDEAREVRFLAPFADILILGYTPPAFASDLAALDVMQTVFSAEYANALSESALAAGVLLKIHLKIDGGMCRLGFAPEAIDELLCAASERQLRAVGIYTHFPVADQDKTATRAAFSRFLSCRQALCAHGLSLFSHAAASAALLTLPETVLDGARIGLALYGVPPVKTALPLTPALTLKAPVIQIRRVRAGTPVGYGGSFVTARPSLIGTLPIGYADGVPRAFGRAVGCVCVLHGNEKFSVPVAGHICMDQMMVDLTDTPAAVGDLAVIFDDAAAAAAALGTIPYEIFTAIGARVIRRSQKDDGRLL